MMTRPPNGKPEIRFPALHSADAFSKIFCNVLPARQHWTVRSRTNFHEFMPISGASPNADPVAHAVRSAFSSKPHIAPESRSCAEEALRSCCIPCWLPETCAHDLLPWLNHLPPDL